MMPARSDDHRFNFDLGEFHCSRVLQEAWLRFGCPDPATVVYANPDGSKAGWCWRHAREAKALAESRGWKVA